MELLTNAHVEFKVFGWEFWERPSQCIYLVLVGKNIEKRVELTPLGIQFYHSLIRQICIGFRAEGPASKWLFREHDTHPGVFSFTIYPETVLEESSLVSSELTFCDMTYILQLDPKRNSLGPALFSGMSMEQFILLVVGISNINLEHAFPSLTRLSRLRLFAQ